MIKKILNKEKEEFILLATAIVLSGALIGFGAYMGGRASSRGQGTDNSDVKTAFGNVIGNNQANNQQPTQGTQSAIVDPVTSQDHIKGDIGARVQLVEYSDPECPFCKMFDPIIKQVLNKFDNSQVAWIYRNYPIDSLHPKARKEAEATECAAEVGGSQAFWTYYDQLFAVTPSNNGLDPAELPVIAKTIGLDVNAFNSCLNSGKYASKIQASIDSGNKAQVTGTPTSFLLVDGKVVKTIVGSVSPSELESDINNALK